MNQSQSEHTEQPAPVAPANDAPIVFLGIGVVVNLLLVTAYFVWAYRQSRKRRTPED